MGQIVIVGGGIIGTSLAYHLRDASDPVVVYEKDRLGTGTTGDSISIFVHYQEHPNRTEFRLRQHAWEECYEPLIERGTLSFDRIGTLHTARSEAGMADVEAIEAELRSYGLETEFLSPRELVDYAIESDAIRGGMYLPFDGALDPTEIIQYFVENATDEGVTVETGVEVTDVRTSDGAVTAVETTEGLTDADVVVNAAGPWASRIDEMVDLSFPIRHTFGPILVLRKPPEFTLPLTFFEEGYYLCQESRTRAFAGKFAVDYEDAFDLDPDHNVSVDSEFYLDVERLIADNVPALADSEVVNEWKGIRTVTPDHRPFVGETAVNGYYVATGMSGYGITRAPAIGAALAHRITNGTPGEFGEFLAYMSPSRDV